jgi:hypothetical protein
MPAAQLETVYLHIDNKKQHPNWMPLISSQNSCIEFGGICDSIIFME